MGLVALLVLKAGELLKACDPRFAFGLTTLWVLSDPLQLLFKGFGSRLVTLLLFLKAVLLLTVPSAVVAFPWNAVSAVEL